MPLTETQKDKLVAAQADLKSLTSDLKEDRVVLKEAKAKAGAANKELKQVQKIVDASIKKQAKLRDTVASLKEKAKA